MEEQSKQMAQILHLLQNKSPTWPVTPPRSGCFKCHELGHFAKECPHARPRLRSTSPSSKGWGTGTASIKHLRAEQDGHHTFPSNDTGQPSLATAPPVVPSSKSLTEVVLCNSGKRTTRFSMIIPIKMNRLDIPTVVDTAAEATIVSQAVYNQLKAKADLTDGVVLTGLVHNTGNEGQLMTRDLSIEPHTFKWRVYVAETPDQCLLGLDFFIHHGVDIKLSTNSITIKGEEILATLG